MKRYVNAYGYRALGATVPQHAVSATMPDSPVYALPWEGDLERTHPPETDDESYARNERVMLAAAAEVERLKPIVGRPVGEPVPALTWTCAVCKLVHPIDHEGFFCATCQNMAACIACERTFTGQCHAGAFSDRDVEWYVWPLRSVGGQHVGSPSGVIGVHRPTGIAAVSDCERSQMRNKEAAIGKLRMLFAANAGRQP